MWTVVFRNAVNGRRITHRYPTRDQAEHAARTWRPFNNTDATVWPPTTR